MITMYNVKDVMRILDCGKNTAYEIMKTSGFPSIKIGRKLLVESNELEEWIKENAGKSIGYKRYNF